MARPWGALVVVAVAVAACQPPGESLPDAGHPDAGALDAGRLDAGRLDAGAGDAGPSGCGCDAGRCLPDGGCVGCLASPFDTCGPGEFCASGSCVPGCHDAAGCGSGLCLPSHDCDGCRVDAECSGGRLCGTGLCSAACSSAASCPAGWDCCGGRCVDPARDPGHCGTCGTACAAADFCGQGQCRQSLLASLCDQAEVVALLDGIDVDDATSRALAAAVASSCGRAGSVLEAGQTDAGVLDPRTGEPLRLGAVLVAGGGSYRQRAVDWLETQGLAPIIGPTSNAIYQYTRPDGGVVAEALPSSITPSHDLFVVQLARAPSGAVVLNAAGIFSPGTTAAGWYAVNRLLPAPALAAKAWYVVEWTDSGDGAPGDADAWTVVASGT